jgi:Tol biopolymer transport system component
VYYLGNKGGFDQIWRVEVDGKTVVQVPHEITTVTDFDVSPVDGKLAYISNNDLIIAEPDGTGRNVIVDGPPTPTAENPDRINLEMRQVYWSPDGKRIAYGLGGVNLIDAAGGTPFMLKQSDPIPKPPNYQSDGPVRLYWPLEWSPDGTRILANFAFFPEAGGLSVLTIADQKTVDVVSTEGYVCCAPTWSADGKSIYYANPAPGMISPGLWRADAHTGQSTTLIEGITKTEWRLVGYAHHAPDGALTYFYATQPADASGAPPMNLPMTLYRAQADGISDMKAMRNDSYFVGEVSWVPDGSGALIVDAAAAVQAQRYPVTGTLVYLKADGSSAIQLPAEGHLPRWGVLPTGLVSGMDDPVLVWEGHTEIGDVNANTCKRLALTASGAASVGPCSDAVGDRTDPLRLQSMEWQDIQSHFASFEYTTPDEHLTFHGAGQLTGPAWQRAIATWARFTYSELVTGQTSASVRTALSWWMGELPDQPGYCGRLIVLAYGLASRNVEPCGGGEVKSAVGDWLTTNEWETFDVWLYDRKAFYGGNSYFSGLGTAEMDQAEADHLAAWAKQVYKRLMK